MPGKFVPLDRSFHELSIQSEEDEIDFQTARFGKSLSWADILAAYRTVILSEAGSGKTEEIRHSAQTLRASNSPAFFLRLEHMADDFDVAFEEGSIEEFNEWLSSDSEGWLFLDSIDEARLREPRDFERAIRRLGARLTNALQRTHIVLSGRGRAWRPVTDLALCDRHLAYRQPSRGNDPSQTATTKDKSNTAFSVVALDDLNASQIEKFAIDRGVTPAAPFLKAIDRADAWSMAARPDDLAELIDFWQNNARIGNRLELMQANVKRRLAERDQNRAETLPLSASDAHLGAQQIAAAVTMAQTSLIRVPDGVENEKGLPAASILPDWNESKLAALLSRPIFDEAIYGALRFHHRTTREYLTAEWLNALLQKQTSRRKIEAILFRKQYGIEVLAPTMRPVLVWLILLDPKIRSRALAISPELVFEGGEPKALPVDIRRAILKDVCDGILSGSSSRSTTDYRAVQRFAQDDIAGDIKVLLAAHAEHDDLHNFLVRMVWQGEIKAALPEVKAIALNRQTQTYTRVAAIRAVEAIGTQQASDAIRKAFLSERGELDREILAELVSTLPPTRAGVAWLLTCIAKLKPKARHSHDDLQEAIDLYVTRLDLNLLPQLIDGLDQLLDKSPHVDARHCAISQRHGWVIKNAAKSVERLVAERDHRALRPLSLAVLTKLAPAQNHRHWDLKDIKSDLPTLISGWPILNDALFWRDIENSRRSSRKDKDPTVTKWWQAGIYRSYWQFTTDDFDRVLNYVASRPLLDDQRVALSLAYRLYTDAKRPRAWRERMKKTTSGNPVLRTDLQDHLHPPQNESAKRWRRQEAAYNRLNDQRAIAEAKREKTSRDYLEANVDKLRHPGLAKPDAITNAQHYLLQKMREASRGSNHWSTGDWKTLDGPFSSAVANAFRDGVVAYWRRYNPKLMSEGKTRNSTPLGTIFGLTGLCIEWRETDDWASTLNPEEATRACRYAMEELNGFPDWLAGLHEAFPDVTLRTVLKELDYNLKIETTKVEHHYILSDLSWSGAAWLWPLLGPEILQRLQSRTLKHVRNLEHMLSILEGSNVSDEAIAELAKHRSEDRRLSHAARWYAAWVGVDPRNAIPALSERLKRTRKGRTELAMMFVTALLGGRRGGTRVREGFRSATPLKQLYTLMHQYIRESDDIERAGTGVYSPGLRDNAQDARRQLFSLLKEIPGKEAYSALTELGQLHPEPSSRPWMLQYAKSKAEGDADLAPWSIEQTLDFQHTIERTPANHRDLFELAELRFLDLKDELEHGDSSIADILIKGATQEPQMRKYIGGWCRDRANGRYAIPQEEELADAKRPDLRMHGIEFDGPVPIELKLAEKWRVSKLRERLENQLCGDYLRDQRSSRGLFVLVYRGEAASWRIGRAGPALSFDELILVLRDHWINISTRFPGVDDVVVVGIDLTRRTIRH